MFLSNDDLLEVRESNDKNAELLTEICQFCRDWHVTADGVYGIFLHDPVSFVDVVRPDPFTKVMLERRHKESVLGHTLMEQGHKRWNGSNTWSGYPATSVAWPGNGERGFRVSNFGEKKMGQNIFTSIYIKDDQRRKKT